MQADTRQIISSEQRNAAGRTLPGMQPVEGQDWIRVDAAYTDQLAEKAALIAEQSENVLACLPEAEDAATEAFEEVLRLLTNRPDFHVDQHMVRRPDGTNVSVDRTAPLVSLSRLIQEDICILQRHGGTYRLTAALLCVPASWTLSEKIGRSLSEIHAPVPEYDQAISKRVRRLFDGVRVGKPMWRANLLRYADPSLYQPRSETNPRTPRPKVAGFERSERQTLWRLPKSGAVVFSIHTTISDIRTPKKKPIL